jgi:hypothetical protein
VLNIPVLYSFPPSSPPPPSLLLLPSSSSSFFFFFLLLLLLLLPPPTPPLPLPCPLLFSSYSICYKANNWKINENNKNSMTYGPLKLLKTRKIL